MVPSYVEAIGFGAFENSHLSKITFAKDINLLTLGWRAFYGAENITEITLPASLISIDYYAFAGCKNLKSCKLGSLTMVGDYSFYETSISELPTLAANATSIGNYSFAKTPIYSIVIPSTFNSKSVKI